VPTINTLAVDLRFILVCLPNVVWVYGAKWWSLARRLAPVRYPPHPTGAIVLGDHPTVNSFLLVRVRADDAAPPMDWFRRPNPTQT
jgi:hypothetical protein